MSIFGENGFEKRRVKKVYFFFRLEYNGGRVKKKDSKNPFKMSIFIFPKGDEIQ